MPYFCPACKARVPEDGDSISCDYCINWHHLQCTDLNPAQFEIYARDKSFEWVCNYCVVNTCHKCNILTKDCSKIQCERCEQKYHLRCAGLSKTAYIPTTSWYCYQCNEDIFPFNIISVNQILNLSFNSLNLDKHPNQLQSIHNASPNNEPDFSSICNVCLNKVCRPNSAIPCPSCKTLIHRKCSKLSKNHLDHFKNNPNTWECHTCFSDKFPFMESDDIDLFMDSFNSNWTCGCKSKTQKYIPSPVSNEYKLILNRHDSASEYNEMYLEDFDENFDLYHSLKPDFNDNSTSYPPRTRRIRL